MINLPENKVSVKKIRKISQFKVRFFFNKARKYP